MIKTKQFTELSHEEKWQAVENCDKRYDGLFLYGVVTAKFFCHPSCRSKTPTKANIRHFESAKSAMIAGFSPCKKCRPDLASFAPDVELIDQVKEILAQHYQVINLSDLATSLGVSESHLSKLFKRFCGITITQHLTNIRINRAKDLLRLGEDSILGIANTVGFLSISRFYACFKEQTGQTPHAYRKGKGEEI